MDKRELPYCHNRRTKYFHGMAIGSGGEFVVRSNRIECLHWFGCMGSLYGQCVFSSINLSGVKELCIEVV